MRILFSSDSPTSPTGFSNQMTNIAQRALKYNIKGEYLGWQTIKQMEHTFENGQKVDVLPVVNDQDAFGRQAFGKYTRENNYDAVLTLGDAWMMGGMNAINQDERPFWMFYYPVDGHPLNSDIYNTINNADYPVAMSKYGYQMVREAGLQTDYIPHAINTKELTPVSKKKKKLLRNQYFPELRKDTILIGSIARFNPRKHHMRLFQAYRKLLDETEKDVKLYLHGDLNDMMYWTSVNGHNYILEELLDTLDLTDHVILPKDNGYSFQKGYPRDMLVDIMSCIDFHVLPTGGEGFGIPTLEMMALGIPTIATDYTTSRELLMHTDPFETDEVERGDERGILVPYSRLYLEKPQVHKAWVDVNAFKDAMALYVDNPALVEQHGRNGSTFAKKYDWNVIYRKWHSLFANLSKIKMV